MNRTDGGVIMFKIHGMKFSRVKNILPGKSKENKRQAVPFCWKRIQDVILKMACEKQNKQKTSLHPHDPLGNTGISAICLSKYFSISVEHLSIELQTRSSNELC